MGLGRSGAAALLATALAAAPGPAQEAGAIEAAAVRVDATGADAGVEVRLRVLPGGAGSVPLRALLPGGTSLAAVEARVGGVPVAVRDLVGEGPVLDGALDLPAGVVGAGPVEVALAYRVVGGAARAGQGLRVRVPVVAPAWPPAAALPGTFQVEVALPAGLELREAFPAAWRALDAAQGDGPTLLASDLPVVPALVRLRAEPPGVGVLAPPRVATVAVALVLLLAGVLGGRALLREGG